MNIQVSHTPLSEKKVRLGQFFDINNNTIYK